ncbi:hypothetical protein AURDEDRAFT_124030 [Auricularia subglabra TFB-10046 SS5]|nr:hypothetical protein AURDEDRAFT_124030 [Auricularia subglabra TFB-10046 SS5]
MSISLLDRHPGDIREPVVASTQGPPGLSSISPPSESADRLSFYGVILGILGYGECEPIDLCIELPLTGSLGINLTVFILTLLYLRRSGRRGWECYIWVAFVVILFAVNTASTMVYRCWTIYAKGSIALILSGVVFLIALASSMASLILVLLLRETYWSHVRLNTGLGFAALSCTVILTVVIVARLLRARHSVRKSLNNTYVPYLSLAALLIESAFAYTAGTATFLIAYYLRSSVEYLVYPLALQAQVRMT